MSPSYSPPRSSTEIRSIAQPRVSFNLGLTGICFHAAELVRLSPEGPARAAFADEAKRLLGVAARESKRQGAFTFDPKLGGELGREELTAGVFTGLAGLGYVETLLGAAVADARLRAAGIARIERTYRAHCALGQPPGELFMGTAGYVALCTDLGARGIASASISRIEADAAARLSERHRRRSEPSNLGGAHGMTGELIALLLAPHALPERSLKARLDELLKLATVDGDYIAWPAHRGGDVPSPTWASFCNGVVGQTILYARAFAVFGEERYRLAATRGAQTCFDLGGASATLCCGAAGAVTALAYAGRVLENKLYKQRSVRRLRALGERRSEERSHIFLQGDLGTSWLELLAEHREPLHFPLLRGLHA